ncbi:MAG: DUF1566 domain-containing protein [Gammaproteobacteria bacterium]|nr:DUF1566 domain-containing protein [Gammaproteobacteria bacterium]
MNWVALAVVGIGWVISAALHAQECNSQVVATTPSSVFTINSDGTVTDNRTGLVWDACNWGKSGADCTAGSATHYSWQDALAQAALANGANYKGYNDWRLPNIKELMSLVERRCQGPAINLDIFPNASSNPLWSASPLVSGSGASWTLRMDKGSVYYVIHNEFWGVQVRLVRGGND